MGSRTAKAAVRAPPSCFAELSVQKARARGDTAEFVLACRACAGPRFYFLCYPIIAPDPSPYYGVAPGDVLHRPPHHVECADCGTVALLFNSASHGYDGALGNGASYSIASLDQARSRISDNAGALSVVLTYNVSDQELDEYAAEDGIDAVLLFDAFAADLVHNDEVVEALEYECA